MLPFSFPLSPETLRESLLVTITICVAFLSNSLLRSLIRIPHRLETRTGEMYATIVRNVITLIIFYVALHIIFLILKIDITPLLASAGIIGIIMGIGAQSLVKDLIAGFFLISQATIAIGDYINVGAGIEGTVKSIGLKNLTLLGANGTLIVVPNGQVTTLINYSYGRANIILDVSVKANISIEKIFAIFNDILKNLQDDKNYIIYKESKIIGVKSIDGNGITISILLITPYSLRGVIEPEFYLRVIKEFEKKKLHIT